MTRTTPNDLTPAPDADAMPHALTFFLTRGERSAVLDALRAHARVRGRRTLDRAGRTRALLGALGLATSRRKDGYR